MALFALFQVYSESSMNSSFLKKHYKKQVYDKKHIAQKMVQLFTRHHQSLFKQVFSKKHDAPEVIQHLKDVTSDFLFDLLDSDESGSITQEEFDAVVGQVLTDEGDRAHVSGKLSSFLSENGLSELDSENFEKWLSQDESQDDYKLHEDGEAAGQRLLKLLLEDETQYGKTVKYVFDLLDLDSNQSVDVEEVVDIGEALEPFSKERMSREQIQQQVQGGFRQAQQMGLGNGESIPFDQYQNTMKQFRPLVLSFLQ